MKKILIVILILAFVGVGSVFAMGAPKEIPQPRAFVISVSGESQLKRNDQWADLKGAEELKEKDAIKTGSDGEVVINFYDNSTSRIGPGSEVSFEELFIDDSNYGKTRVGLMVSIGRIWSRIIQLTDKEASFEVGSSATVATVRGTTFDFEVTAEGIAKVNAVESIVEVATVEFKDGVREIIAKVNLTEGNLTRIDQRKEVKELRKIEREVASEEVKKEEWFRRNIERDEKFEEEIEKKQREMIEEMAGVLPDSALYGIKKAAENIRLTLTNDQDKKEELEASYASRRLAEAQELADLGEKELAQRAMEEFEKGAEDLTRKREELEKRGEDVGKIERIENQIRNQINIQKEVLGEVAPGEEIYSLKIELEKIEIDNFAQEEEKEFLMFKQAEERLKEAEILRKEDKEQLYQQTLEQYQEQVQELKQENTDPSLIERIELKRGIIQDPVKELFRQELKEILEPATESQIRTRTKETIQKTGTETKEEPTKEEPGEIDSSINQAEPEIIDQKADISPVFEEVFSNFEEVFSKEKEEPIIQEPEIFFDEPVYQEPVYEEPVDKEPEYQEPEATNHPETVDYNYPETGYYETDYYEPETTGSDSNYNY